MAGAAEAEAVALQAVARPWMAAEEVVRSGEGKEGVESGCESEFAGGAAQLL